MGADSLPRRILKRALAPVLDERSYKYVQALSKVWDIRTKGWDEPELEILDQLVRPGDTVLDIGANYGLYAYHLSKCVGPRGRVIAFEPLPFTSATFKIVARILRFRNVELVERGCGERNEEISFTVPVQQSGAIMAGLVHIKGRNNDRPGKELPGNALWAGTKDVTCQVVRIDDYLHDLEGVAFIKCDIEGADLYAMRGAQQTLTKHRPIVLMEINPWFLEGFGLKVEDIVSFFEGLGFGMYRLQNRMLVPTTAAQVVSANYFFVPSDRRDRAGNLLSPS